MYLIDYTKVREMDPNGFWKKRRFITSIECVNRKKVTITVLSVESIDESWNRLTLQDSILNIRNAVISLSQRLILAEYTKFDGLLLITDILELFLVRWTEHSLKNITLRR